MKAIPTALDGVLILEPRLFEDERGWLMETWNSERFREAGIEADFVQDNHSRSARGVLRGLHYQLQRPQGKLVRAVRGRIFDVAVDVRRSSPAFGRWAGADLSAENRRLLWIPPGFAHGFLSLEDGSECLYKCTGYYDAGDERAILWSDAAIGIKWPSVGPEGPLLSPRDRAAPPLLEAETFA